MESMDKFYNLMDAIEAAYQEVRQEVIAGIGKRAALRNQVEDLEKRLGDAKALIMCLQGEVARLTPVPEPVQWINVDDTKAVGGSVYTNVDYPDAKPDWKRGWSYDVMRDVIFSD